MYNPKSEFPSQQTIYSRVPFGMSHKRFISSLILISTQNQFQQNKWFRHTDMTNRDANFNPDMGHFDKTLTKMHNMMFLSATVCQVMFVFRWHCDNSCRHVYDIWILQSSVLWAIGTLFCIFWKQQETTFQIGTNCGIVQ